MSQGPHAKQTPYPGHIIKLNEGDPGVVRTIAAGLYAKGYKSLSPDGVFDNQFKSIIQLYQSQNADAFGRPLEVDGEVGSLTWGSIFGVSPIDTFPSGEAAAALGIAISQLGVMENPLGSNRGPKVDQYQIEAGLSLPNDPSKEGFFWCMAFVYWCFKHAGNGNTEFPKTSQCTDAWSKVKKKSPDRVISRSSALADPSIVKPGMVFILEYGGGAGHTGFVRQSAGGALKTVEGNTNPNGGSNGLGVFELNRRKIIDKALKGFLDFT